ASVSPSSSLFPYTTLFRSLVQRALGFRIESADRVHVLVKQLDAIRLGATHREDVEQRAAHRKIAGIENLRHVAVAGGLQAAFFGDRKEHTSELQSREHLVC